MITKVNVASSRLVTLTEQKNNRFIKHGCSRAGKMIAKCISILAPLLQESVLISQTQTMKIITMIKSSARLCESREKKTGPNSRYYGGQKKIFHQLLFSMTLSMEENLLTHERMLMFLQNSYTQVKELQIKFHGQVTKKSSGIIIIQKIAKTIIPNTNFTELYAFDDFISEINCSMNMGKYKSFSWVYDAFGINKRELFKNKRLEKILYLAYVGKSKPSLFYPKRGRVEVYYDSENNLISSDVNNTGRLLTISLHKLKNYNDKYPVGIALENNLLILSQDIRILRYYNILGGSVKKKFDPGSRYYRLIKMLANASADDRDDSYQGIIDKIQRGVGSAAIEKLIYTFLMRISMEGNLKDALATALLLLDRIDTSSLVTVSSIQEEIISLFATDIRIGLQRFAAIPLGEEDRDLIFDNYKPKNSRGISQDTKKLFFLIFRILEVGVEQLYLLEEAKVSQGHGDVFENNVINTIRTIYRVKENATWAVNKTKNAMQWATDTTRYAVDTGVWAATSSTAVISEIYDFFNLG
ncbi:MAG: hypothetical protein GY710_23775 [Desulfobacteraceae bacterium]|nr:hypothetical protein [Desulfobacteraceae bacterium]